MHYTCCRNAYGGWCFLLPSKKSQHRLTLIIFSSILLRTRTNCCYERGVFATCDCRKWDVTEISRRGLLLKNVVVFTSKPRNWTSLFFLGRQTAEKAALPYDAAQSHVRLSHVYLVVFFISALTVLLYATVFIWLCVWFFFSRLRRLSYAFFYVVKGDRDSGRAAPVCNTMQHKGAMKLPMRPQILSGNKLGRNT